MPCRVCEAIDHSMLTCPGPFSASSEKVLLRQIMARNPDYTHAEALRKVEKDGPTGSAKPSTGEEIEERQTEEEPALELVGQDLVEPSSKAHVSSCDELFHSRRRDAPKTGTEPKPGPQPSFDELFTSRRRSAPEAETAAQAQILQTGRHEEIIANATDTAHQRRVVCLDRRVKAAEALAQRRTTVMAHSDDARQLYMASALKHFRNREEKRETDRVSEAGSYRGDEVVDPVVGDGARAEIEDRDEQVAEGKRERVVHGGGGLDGNFPWGRDGKMYDGEGKGKGGVSD